MATFLKIPTTYYKLVGDYTVNDEIINVDYFTINLLAKIQEWENNNLTCMMTNEHLADFFHCSVSTVKRHLKRLTDLGWVSREQNRKVIEGRVIVTRTLATTEKLPISA